MLPVKQQYGKYGKLALFLPKYHLNIHPGLWPTSGEIDLMESRGNVNLMQDGVNIGAEQFGSTLHYGVDYTMNGYEFASTHANSPPGQGFNQDFHRYQVQIFIFKLIEAQCF